MIFLLIKKIYFEYIFYRQNQLYVEIRKKFNNIKEFQKRVKSWTKKKNLENYFKIYFE